METLEAQARPQAHATAFDSVAESYDHSFTDSLIGRAQRRAVWQELDRLFQPGQRILEIGCGTGVDAMHLSGRGIDVLACDASPRMIEVARRRSLVLPGQSRVEFRALAAEEIQAVSAEGPFDGAFSNFAGLNCVDDLFRFAGHLQSLLRPGARVLLCVFGSCCAWELLWYLGHGNLRKAMRRFQSEGTTTSPGNGATVHVRYPSVRTLVRMLAPGFRLLRWKGVGVAVPPSYLEPWARRFPGTLRFLEKADRRIAGIPFARGLGDHAVLTLERVQG